jgi:hypothetical protein
MKSGEETQKSLANPDARLMKDKKGFDVSYNVQTSVDTKHKLIAESVRTQNEKADFNKTYNSNSLFVKQVRINTNPAITDRRKELVEHPFGTIKRAMDASYVLT